MVKINKVYQTVLALANKEQRGYITPQEFNLFADHAQMDIFEQYFYDLNQFKRIPGNDTNYSDMVNLIEEKIERFIVRSTRGGSTPFFRRAGFTQSSHTIPQNFYRLVNVENLNGSSIEKLSWKDYEKAVLSPLTRGTKDRAISCIRDQIFFVCPPSDSIIMNYIKKPQKPNWTYIVVNEKPLYNSTAEDHRDFDLHESEQKELVIKILQLAGISIKDYEVTQVAAEEENKTIIQQKS
jgi:hypothetical protein